MIIPLGFSLRSVQVYSYCHSKGWVCYYRSTAKLPPGQFLLCIGNQEQVLTRQEYFAFIYAKDKKKTDWKARKGGKRSS